MNTTQRRGYCSKCGGALTNGKPCEGGGKVMKPVEIEARSLATAFVMSRKETFGDVSQNEIDTAISKVARALRELIEIRST